MVRKYYELETKLHEHIPGTTKSVVPKTTNSRKEPIGDETDEIDQWSEKPSPFGLTDPVNGTDPDLILGLTAVSPILSAV